MIAHNVEHRLFARQVEQLPTYAQFAAPLLRREVQKLKDYELAGARAIERLVCISSEDSKYFAQLSPHMRIFHLPPVFSYSAFRRKVHELPEGSMLKLGFLANLAWWPNKEGLDWFLDKVYPNLGEHIQLHLFGNGSRQISGNHSRVTGHGFVDDIADVWRRCDIMICPIVSGSGVNIKFAEAIYNGMPTISTPLAARGLGLPPDPAVIQLDSPEQWIDFLNSGRASEMASKVPAPALSAHFAPESYTQSLVEFLEC
jgi:hypothetical protein